MPVLVGDDLVPYLRRLPEICRWIDSFTIQGQGVDVKKNALGGLAISIGTAAAGQGTVKAVKDIRYNGTTHYLQITYADSPAESSWLDRVEFTTCAGATPGEFFSF